MLSSARFSDYTIRDLEKSGLAPEDINARPLDGAERATTLTPHAVQGYVIPYYDAHQRIRPFYRVRLFESDVKYRQPKDSPNHVYFPKLFQKRLQETNHKYVIITEGEKKSALATKLGFPTVGLSGVDSWRNKTILVPGDAQLTTHGSKLAIRIPSDSETDEEFDSPLAIGMLELIDLIVQKRLEVVIIYDSDNTHTKSGVKSDVQRAAASLAYELRFRGIPFVSIRQLVLPALLDFDYQGDKVGLDDYLTHRTPEDFRELLTETLGKRGAFPRHPNVRDYVNRRLQRAKLSRKEIQSVALAILSDLDANGRRLRSQQGDTFYFDNKSHQMLRSEWPTSSDGEFDSPFIQFLYREYGLSGNDSRMLMWLGTQFTAEQPIDIVNPQRILARPIRDEDSVCLQISDSQFVRVTAEGLTVHANGENNVLFEANQCEPLDPEKLLAQFITQRRVEGDLHCWWAHTLSKVRLRDKDKQRVVASLLYYMSPWLFRWRGMQLPVELVVGESGSGKSTLCELRLDILTGRPILRNSPTDIKDWHASVSSSGGLHVTDNVQLIHRELRHRLSDEICRIVTEPDPFIEQRKYYTNADLIRIPVRCVFAITAIQQPFQNADLLQRAFILELDKSVDATEGGLVRYDGQWKTNQLAYRGGREGWIAHHLVVLHRFFQKVKESWDDNYYAKQRLINFEQGMTIMASVFGIPTPWVPDFLVQATEEAVSEADWILEGLHAWSIEHFNIHAAQKKFLASAISEWCEAQQEYKDCDMLVNIRKLGRYMRAHKSAIFNLTGIQEAGTYANRIAYRFKGKPMKKREQTQP